MWLIFLLFLAGCLAPSVKEREERLLRTPSLEESQQKAYATLFREGEWPSQEWWEALQSPSLTQLIEEALSQNPTLQVVESRIAYAKAEASLYKANLFPTLFFQADDNWRHLSKHGFTHLLNPKLALSGYEVDLSLAFQYEFDFWGKYRNLFRSALGLVKASEAELIQAKLILSSALAQGYFTLLVTKTKQGLYEKIRELKVRTYALQGHLMDHALSSLLVPLHDEQEVKEIEKILSAVQEEVEKQTHLINNLRGKAPDTPIPLDPLTTSLSPPSLPKDLSLHLLARRPDLLAQLWRVEAMAWQIGAAKANFFPSVNLVAFAGLASIALPNLFTPTSQTTGVDPVLSLPLFTGGAIRAGVRSKQAKFQEAVSEYNALVLSCVQEVADLLSSMQAAFAKREYQEKIVEASEQRLDLTVLRQQGGLEDAFTLFQREEDLLRVRLDDLDLLYSQYALTIKLMKALGGGYHASPPLQPQSEEP